MGVLNVTPDSFSDGGRYARPRRRGRARRCRCGPTAPTSIDVGGESTRPGRAAGRRRRRRSAGSLPVIARARRRGRADSASTPTGPRSPPPRWRPARSVVNDVSGGLGDPDMAAVVRDAGCPWILMHWRGHSARMQRAGPLRRRGRRRPRPSCRARVDAALAAGVDPAQLVHRPRARLRQDRRAQLGAAAPARRACRARACRCWSAPRASRSSGALLADARRHAAPGRRARGRHHRADRLLPRCTACGGCGCTRCARRSTPR